MTKALTREETRPASAGKEGERVGRRQFIQSLALC